MKTILISTIVCLLTAHSTYAVTSTATSATTTQGPTSTGVGTTTVSQTTTTSDVSTTTGQPQTTTVATTTAPSTGTTTTVDPTTTTTPSTGTTTAVDSTTTTAPSTVTTTAVDSTTTTAPSSGTTTTIDPTTTAPSTATTTTVDQTTTTAPSTGTTTTVDSITTTVPSTGTTTILDQTTTTAPSTGTTTTVDPTTTTTATSTGTTTTVDSTTTTIAPSTVTTTTADPTTSTTAPSTGPTTTVDSTTTTTAPSTGTTTTVDPTTTTAPSTGTTTAVDSTTTTTPSTGTTTAVDSTTTTAPSTGTTTIVDQTTTTATSTGTTTTVDSTTTTIAPSTVPTTTADLTTSTTAPSTGTTTAVDSTTTTAPSTETTTIVDQTTTTATSTGTTTTVDSTTTTIAPSTVPTTTADLTTSTTAPSTGTTTAVDSTTTTALSTGTTTIVDQTTTTATSTGTTTTVDSTTTSIAPSTGTTTTVDSTSSTTAPSTGPTTTVDSTTTPTEPSTGTTTTVSTTTVEPTTTTAPSTVTTTPVSTTTVEPTTTAAPTTLSTTTVEPTTTAAPTTLSTTTVEPTTTTAPSTGTTTPVSTTTVEPTTTTESSTGTTTPVSTTTVEPTTTTASSTGTTTPVSTTTVEPTTTAAPTTLSTTTVEPTTTTASSTGTTTPVSTTTVEPTTTTASSTGTTTPVSTTTVEPTTTTASSTGTTTPVSTTTVEPTTTTASSTETTTPVSTTTVEPTTTAAPTTLSTTSVEQTTTAAPSTGTTTPVSTTTVEPTTTAAPTTLSTTTVEPTTTAAPTTLSTTPVSTTTVEPTTTTASSTGTTTPVSTTTVEPTTTTASSTGTTTPVSTTTVEPTTTTASSTETTTPVSTTTVEPTTTAAPTTLSTTTVEPTTTTAPSTGTTTPVSTTTVEPTTTTASSTETTTPVSTTTVEPTTTAAPTTGTTTPVSTTTVEPTTTTAPSTGTTTPVSTTTVEPTTTTAPSTGTTTPVSTTTVEPTTTTAPSTGTTTPVSTTTVEPTTTTAPSTGTTTPVSTTTVEPTTTTAPSTGTTTPVSTTTVEPTTTAAPTTLLTTNVEPTTTAAPTTLSTTTVELTTTTAPSTDTTTPVSTTTVEPTTTAAPTTLSTTTVEPTTTAAPTTGTTTPVSTTTVQPTTTTAPSTGTTTPVSTTTVEPTTTTAPSTGTTTPVSTTTVEPTTTAAPTTLSTTTVEPTTTAAPTTLSTTTVEPTTTAAPTTFSTTTVEPTTTTASSTGTTTPVSTTTVEPTTTTAPSTGTTTPVSTTTVEPTTTTASSTGTTTPVSTTTIEPTTTTSVTPTTTTTTITTTPPDPTAGLAYPDYSSSTNVASLTNQDDGCAPMLMSSIKVPYNDREFKQFYVCVNGFVSLRSPYNGFSTPISGQWAPQFGNLLAVFMTDLNLYVAGVIWYQLYDKNVGQDVSDEPVVLKAEELVADYYNDNNFDAVITLIATWEEVAAYGGSSSQTATFQLIFTSDGKTSYVFYSYLAGGMNVLTFSVFIGLVKDGEAEGLPNNNIAAVQFLLRPDINLCQNGPCPFKVGVGVEKPEIVCKKWFRTEKNQRQRYTRAFNRMPDCPCNFFVALFGGQYAIDWWTGGVFTAILWPNRNFGNFGKTCVYNWGLSFIGTGFRRGNFQKFNSLSNRRDYEKEDKKYHRLCCEENNFCSLFDEVRPPTSSCNPWARPIFISFFFGDPHFTTLDGLTYTFNGHGEYILIDIPEESFQIQTRTGRAITSTGNFSEATIFTAYAIQGNGTWLQMELNENRTQISLFSGTSKTSFVDYTSDFYNLGDNFKVINAAGPSLERNNKTLIAKFTDIGISFNITIGVKLLQSSIAVPGDFENRTKGLLGNFNGEKDDDLLPRDATQPITIASSESAIFNNFGKTWVTTPEESVFKYLPGKSHDSYAFPDFEPGFYDEATDEKKQEAETECGGNTNKQCLFDYVFTGNKELALETLDTETTLTENIAIVENQVPELSITVGAELVIDDYFAHVTVGVEKSLTIQINDTDAVTVTAEINSAGATLTTNTDGTVTATFTLSDTNAVQLGFVGTDTSGAHSPILDVVIVVCSGCNSHGACDFNNYQERDTVDDNFHLAMCNCTSYWEGDNCNEDYDACIESTCSVGQNCTDTSADAQEADDTLPPYTCSECPVGFIDNQSKCQDLNECSNTSICTNAACVNNDGSYTCTCNTGYRQGSTLNTCSDIDECAESTSNCDHTCTNTDGGFTCSCFPGFKRNDGDTACETDTNSTLVECNGKCTYAEGCTVNSDNEAVCFCNNGYQLFNESSTDSNCTDVNECDIGVCSQNCENTDGEFTCSCYTGYSLDSDSVTCTQCEYPSYGINCSSTCRCGRGSVRCDPIQGCVCGEGWTGDICELDVNECSDPNTCSGENEECSNIVGSYSCVCSSGYSYQDLGSGTVCADNDECADITLNDCEQTCLNTQGTFTCGCEAGYNVNPTNNTLCDDIDECTEGISGCSQKCINAAGRFNCECFEGFVLAADRKECIKEEDLCLLFNTKNCSDICIVEDSQPVCYCNSGYTLGADNQTCIDNNECLSNTTNRCTEQDKCRNSEGSYVCSCSIGFRLENDLRTCTGCDEYHYGVNCENQCNCGVGAAQCDPETGCVCNEGWAGEKCNIDKDECEASPCTGDHVICVNEPGTFSCSCESGYENTTGVCTDVDECLVNTLNLCSQVCTNSDGGYECSCNAGFLKNGTSCGDIDECSGQHNCEQVCNNVIGSYRCSCQPDFKLNADKRTCSPINVCGNPAICTGGADCVNRSGVDTCVCKQGYAFDTGSNTMCIDIKECNDNSLHSCAQKCNEEAGGYTCSCDQAGYVLDVDETSCRECDQGSYGMDCASNCTCVEANTASCNHIDGNCTCSIGWEGNDCDEDINECLGNPCPSQSACVDTEGSYICQCVSGYIKAADGTCAACDPTHWGNSCANLCDCVTANTADCNDKNGTCTCLKGWKGTNCDNNINECTELPNVCNDTLKTCVDQDGSYDCLCVPGYTINSNNVCVDDDECLLGTHNCSGVEQICVNAPGSFTCACADGYSGDGTTCTECSSGTWGTQCGNTCACNATNTEVDCDPANGCVCKTGWQGADCSEDIDECSTAASNSCPAHSECTNTQGSYNCPCLVGFLDTNGACTTCDQNTYGDNCTSTCNCTADHATYVNQTCNHISGKCICKTTWTGQQCELDYDECAADTVVCTDSDKGCYNMDGGYSCTCLVGYVQDGDACVLSTATTTTPAVPGGVIRIIMYVELNLSVNAISSSHNLRVLQTLELYIQWAQIGLKAFFQSRMTATRFRDLVILHVEEGSLKVNFSVNIADTIEAKQELSVATFKLASGEVVQIDDQNTSAQALTIGGQNVNVATVSEESIKCLAYFEANAVCDSNEECVLVDGNPTCEPKTTDDNLALILGLGVGIPLFFVAVLMIAVIVMLYVKNRRKHTSEDLDRTTFNHGFFPAVVPTKINTWGKSDPVYGPYAWDQQSGDSFTTSSSSDETHKKRRHRRRGENYLEPRDEYVYDNQNNFSWDFLYNYIAPNERYEIQRPHVDNAGGRGYRN